MRDDWATIVQSLTDRNVRVTIITNGFLFTEDLIDTLKKVKVESVAISLDGPREIHDKYRQAGSFERAISAIDVLSANGIPVSVISTLHEENVPLLDEMYEVLKGKKIFAWQLQACSPMGNAGSGLSTDIDFGEVIRFVEKHLWDEPFAIGIADNIGYYTESEGYLRGNHSGQARYIGCNAGLTTIGIDSVGNVRGCESMYDEHFIEGTLREKSLEAIWNDPNAFAYNRGFTMDKLTGKCAECEHGSKCAGGCRSYNYFTHGQMYESVKCARNALYKEA